MLGKEEASTSAGKKRKQALGLRFAAALLPRLFGKNPRSHHKGATGRVTVRTVDQLLPVLCHCQLGQDIPNGQDSYLPNKISGIIYEGFSSIQVPH